MIRAAPMLALVGCLAKPGFECDLAPGLLDLGGHIGSNGGVPQDSVTCGGGFAVGLTVALTADRDGGHGNEYIVAKVAMLCAPIAQRDDAAVTGDATTQLVAQGGAMIQGDQTASCASGHAMVGVAANLVTVDGLFNAVSIDCARITPRGLATPEVIAVPDTGTATANAHALCGAGEVIIEMRGWTGNEVDQLELSCAAPSCI